jgi:hypothetical protein
LLLASADALVVRRTIRTNQNALSLREKKKYEKRNHWKKQNSPRMLLLCRLVVRVSVGADCALNNMHISQSR